MLLYNCEQFLEPTKVPTYLDGLTTTLNYVHMQINELAERSLKRSIPLERSLFPPLVFAVRLPMARQLKGNIVSALGRCGGCRVKIEEKNTTQGLEMIGRMTGQFC